MENPTLYSIGIFDECYSIHKFLGIIVRGFFDGFVIFACVWIPLANGLMGTG
jgi:hypothetical protein